MPNPFCHVELSTDDVSMAKKFYKSVFAWTLNDMKGMPYTMIDVGAGVGGGMQPKPMADAPTAWLAYVQVDDVKKTLAKAKKAGAVIALDHTSLGNNGAIGIFVDPGGAPLGVYEAAKQTAPKKKSAASSKSKKTNASKKTTRATAPKKKPKKKGR